MAAGHLSSGDTVDADADADVDADTVETGVGGRARACSHTVLLPLRRENPTGAGHLRAATRIFRVTAAGWLSRTALLPLSQRRDNDAPEGLG
jgi:hypothetical protein